MNDDQVRKLLLTKVEASKKSLRFWAEENGIRFHELTNFMSGGKITQEIEDALGIYSVTYWVRNEFDSVVSVAYKQREGKHDKKYDGKYISEANDILD